MISPVIVESLDQEGRGVAHSEGKVIFIEGALPGELVTYSPYRKKPSFELAQVNKVLKTGSLRVNPRCNYFGICGGCSLQHMDDRAQVAAKQRVLESDLKHIGKVESEIILPAVYGSAWGYRYRARMSVRYVAKKGGVLVGFHEKRSSFVADMQSCEVMPPRISALIGPLRELIGSISLRERLPQVEVSLGEAVDVLVLRIMDPLTDQDKSLLKAFADTHTVQFFLQTKGPETAYPFYPIGSPELNYTLPEFGIVMPFHPTEFTQVNPAMNRILVRRALSLLGPLKGDRIADLFCGLGNFTLPIARSGARVMGYEGSSNMVRRAGENAERNQLSGNTNFSEKNLFEIDAAWLQGEGVFNKLLLDPPRDGAFAVVNSLGEGDSAPTRIVYVSCNPATLSRDAGVLVHAKGYQLKAVGVVNMFPHTSHIESIALFEKS
ncbi:MAG: 23S rRNA (uracil(1939)-C(5))-methyltransferase RlmD [Nitrosomonadaceae bacterium]|nr:23S rRNA (uracil(1939)-C(5))-methyltransferase RlmD [Nitrosospira sp.]MDW7565019.1 23S rRNA (uracil(1939)-C(5))-methyltransferase RlmD [Nitrosomonadaceae bacterium]MBI0410337.1 23S rRNA (uracil(1939)-C(5))-methyltransferase RlmD [Nitrosospira sp.]MBI0411349.1 23S rRNA (uracil(1939)-C(5))-methyltransferase RlmD [Nitrosospira sp.]MBI0420882.1 23S rRNA (uracil(1939)-C(5))-methyltransferase RlmD [Nitrosospira sp.]